MYAALPYRTAQSDALTLWWKDSTKCKCTLRVQYRVSAPHAPRAKDMVKLNQLAACAHHGTAALGHNVLQCIAVGRGDHAPEEPKPHDPRVRWAMGRLMQLQFAWSNRTAWCAHGKLGRVVCTCASECNVTAINGRLDKIVREKGVACCAVVFFCCCWLQLS